MHGISIPQTPALALAGAGLGWLLPAAAQNRKRFGSQIKGQRAEVGVRQETSSCILRCDFIWQLLNSFFTLWPFMVSGKDTGAWDQDEPGLIPFLALPEKPQISV